MSKEIVNNMFSIIDKRQFERLTEVFCDDIIYERPGYKTIRGIEELINFYKNVRIIILGEHLVDKIVAEQSSGASWGIFEGQDRDLMDLKVRFSDCYTFENKKVKTRITYFFKPAI